MVHARPSRLLALAALASAAALGAAAPAASARGPSTSDQASLDWILQRFARDREEENRAVGVVDPVAAFRRGEGPLDGDGGWKAMLAIVYSTKEEAPRKAEAALALVDRFKLEEEKRAKVEEKPTKAEEERRAADLKALADVRKQASRATLNGMLSSNPAVLSCILRIQKGIMPPEWVSWKETDNLKVRRRAYDDLTKRLK